MRSSVDVQPEPSPAADGGGRVEVRVVGVAGSNDGPVGTAYSVRSRAVRVHDNPVAHPSGSASVEVVAVAVSRLFSDESYPSVESPAVTLRWR